MVILDGPMLGGSIVVFVVDKAVVVVKEVGVVLRSTETSLLVENIVESVVGAVVESVVADVAVDESVVVELETGVVFGVVLSTGSSFLDLSIKPTAKPIESSKIPTNTAVTIFHLRF